MTGTRTHDTPIGRFTLTASDAGLTRARFGPPRTPAPTAASPATASPTAASPAAARWLDLARRELDDYVTGRLRAFRVPVDLARVGAPHRRVLDALTGVGYGQTTTYGALAAALGLTDDGPRQVGAALARNPVLVVVPCHRVLGAGGRLVGYAGGLAAKRWLLDLEAHDRAPQLDLARWSPFLEISARYPNGDLQKR